ncbi:MFS transporter [Persicobacter diffluens]|uniref:Major facilitator superfamily (MFS) profile domain-containing protein n=1 Tax=Persicobacter diffluens TaxID=981 RepID=A0AAN4W4A5_9BACT|nr:hypothetical protein PEDI_43370 [Persicobacter diffluens]
MKNNYLQLIKSHPATLTFGANHYFFSSIGQSFFLSLFIPFFMERVGISHDGFSYYYALASFFGGLMLSFIGPIVDQVDVRKYGYFNGLLCALCCIWMAHIHQPWMLLIGLAGLRLSGQGMMPLAGAAAMGKYFHHNRGKALAVAALGMSVGEILAPIFLVALLQYLPWKTLWYWLAIFEGIIFPLSSFLLVGKEPAFAKTALKKGEEKSRQFVKTLLTSGSFWIWGLLFVFTPFLAAGVMIHHHALLNIKGWTVTHYALGFTGFGVARIVISLMAGPMVDRFSAGKISPFLLLPLSLGMILLHWFEGEWVLFLFLLILGGTLSFGSICGTAYWAEIYGPEKMGTAKSMVSTLMVFACAAAPVIFVPLFKASFFPWTFPFLLMLAVVLSFAASKTRPVSTEEPEVLAPKEEV